MCPGKWQRRVSGCVLLLASLSFGAGAAQANGITPLVIPAGFDLFQTQPGTFVMLSLPAGFFGPNSNAFSGTVNLLGMPTGPMGNALGTFLAPFVSEQALGASHNVSSVTPPTISLTDTIIQRLGTATLPSIGSTTTIPIEIVSLSLQGTSPIQVTNNQNPPSFFDVFVDLDPNTGQITGQMQLLRTTPSGGTFTAILPVIPRIVFTPVGGGQPIVLSFTQPIVFTSTSTYTVVPEPGTLALLGLGLSAAALKWRRRHGCPGGRR